MIFKYTLLITKLYRKVYKNIHYVHKKTYNIRIFESQSKGMCSKSKAYLQVKNGKSKFELLT